MAQMTLTEDVEDIDEIALAGARRGDSRAFERLYRAYAGRIYGLCLRMTANHAIAEDCTQETFINAWKGLKDFESRSALGTWLHRIAVNTVLGRARRGEFEMKQELDESAPVPDCLVVLHDELAVQDLEKLLGKLPGGARSVVVLYGVYGYSHEETAQMLGIAVGTCKAQLHRARHLLKDHMMAEGWA
jgi:RNA polymerase sigma-70 factor, ECF subfamily